MGPRGSSAFSPLARHITCEGDLGIGAPVASRILSLFGGSVAVENREPAGVRMVVALPRDTSDHFGSLSPN